MPSKSIDAFDQQLAVCLRGVGAADNAPVGYLVVGLTQVAHLAISTLSGETGVEFIDALNAVADALQKADWGH